MPADIWALGILAYELATGSKVPINDASDEAAEESKELEYRLPASSTFSADYQNFIEGCLRREQNERPNINTLLSYPLLVDAESKKEGWIEEY